jgi:hypothetical protein
MALFENDQWVVTDFGLVSVEPGAPHEYQIAADRLLEMAGAGGGSLYDWPIQLAGEAWVDLDAFIEAFSKALDIHHGRYTGTVDPDLLEQSIAEARRTHAHEVAKGHGWFP